VIISFDNGLKGEQAPTHSLARDYYVSPEVFETELDRFLTAHWIMAGHESEIPEPGDYFRFDVMGYSLILVRGADGSVRAMQNVCRHRGARLYEDARGTISLIRCRYHGWAYRLNGDIVASRHLPESLAKEDYSLIRCGVAMFAGLIFVSLQPERAPDFAALTQNLEPYLARYQMAGCKVIATENYHLTANWKLAVENNLECYHCLMCHPQYTEANAFVRADEKVSAAHVDQFNSYQEAWRARLSALNLPTGRTELVTVGGQPSRRRVAIGARVSHRL
jgi:Rieske 2Fe-2S family protein